jgi:flagellar hook assembly protein FlgD
MEGVAGKPLPVLRWQLTCAPNPLSARAAIRWQVPRQSSVSLKVYNAAGQMVRVLRQGIVKPGSYTTSWNGCDQQGCRLAAGVYVCTLDGPGTRITRKVVLTQ